VTVKLPALPPLKKTVEPTPGKNAFVSDAKPNEDGAVVAVV
jgi:hypothetical protein